MRTAIVETAEVSPLDVVNLSVLMRRTAGRPEVVIGLIDGPVAADHADLAGARIAQPGAGPDAGEGAGAACGHGTFIAGVLCARRGSPAPAICPECSLLVRPIFLHAPAGRDEMPSATPDELAAAILECVAAGARILNLSIAVAEPPSDRQLRLEEALSHAARQGVIVVAATGDRGATAGSAITRHPWTIPVAACDGRGGPLAPSNFGASIGCHGLMAPGDAITSLAAAGGSAVGGGPSVAVPFVTGAIALLWSALPRVGAAAVRSAIAMAWLRRRSAVPPLLDAGTAFQRLAASGSGG